MTVYLTTALDVSFRLQSKAACVGTRGLWPVE